MWWNHTLKLALFLSVLHPASAQKDSQEWATAYSKARTSLAQLTLAEKVSLVTGIGFFEGNCTGSTAPIPKIGFPGFCLQDSALGVRNVDLNSVFPAGINIATTFDRSLMRSRGVAMGEEFRGKGVNVQLGPTMNMMRAPAGGRGWESFGGDPYLQGEAAYETVTGIQSQGVQATAKHWINNEQEHFRKAASSNVDDRTQHEIYMHPFLKSVQANVAAVMCSYNMVNGSYACSNNATLNGLLKGELGFQGYVMSDWLATRSTDSANQGLDMTMPGDIFPLPGLVISYFGQALIAAVGLGKVPQSRVDDMATRILAAWYLLGQDKNYPPVNFNSKDANSSINQHVNVQGNHASLIRQIGTASTILLKNVNGTLPLKSPKSIAVIGSGAGPNPNGPNSCTDRTCDSGVLAMGWGSGTANYPYLVTPLDAITNRSHPLGTNVSSSLSDSDLSAAAATAVGKDVALVFLTADSGEDGYLVELNTGDRNDLFAWHGGDALVKQVASVNPNTVVVINAVGPVIVEAWIDHPNVTALVWSGLPGQEAGNSLADVLFGDANPGGRLPFTIGKSVNDYAAQVDFTPGFIQIPYTEGLYVDYRHFDQAGIAPRYEFGFGLSYTTFDYVDLDVEGTVPTKPPPSGHGSSLDSSLHATAVTVSFTLKNNGSVTGTEIPQLYLSLPPSAKSPPYMLRGFESVSLSPGKSQRVVFNLSRYDLSIWDVPSQRWVVPGGKIGVSVRGSSRDMKLEGPIRN